MQEWRERTDMELVPTTDRECDGRQCDVGICGRCSVGPKYVRVDGPVFSLAEIKELPDEL